jgi:hypothetical protein
VSKDTQLPWASGPGEILRHGLKLLHEDSDTNRRLAMISIDNAVELMIKTFLGLPKRVTGLSIPRKEYQEISESFPALLDTLEHYASDKLDGIDLGSIEWYHRVRNELYHQGNGLTVERDKVEVYAELANLLFRNLFGFQLVEHKAGDTELLGSFMEAWVMFEKAILDTASNISLTGFERARFLDRARYLQQAGILSKSDLAEIDHLRTVRNQVIHNAADYREVIKPDMVKRLKEFADKLEGSHTQEQ